MITLRAATQSDAADLAILDNIASHGLSLWYWQSSVTRNRTIDAIEWGRQRMANSQSPYGYSNALVACSNEVIAGAATGYRVEEGKFDVSKSENKVLKPIFELIDQCVGDWLVDTLAVYYDQRRKNVATDLLDNCFERAKLTRAGKVCLIVADNNHGAVQLYRSRGFVETDRRDFVAFDADNKTRYWVLMHAPVN